MSGGKLSSITLLLGVLISTVLPAQSGIIEGRVLASDKSGLGGIEVKVEGQGQTISDPAGNFVLTVPPGQQQVHFTLGELSDSVEIEVLALTVVRIEHTLDWEPSLAQRTVIESLTRQAKRLMEVPVATTAIAGSRIDREGVAGQTPRLLDFTTGADLLQNGLYDFNLTTRGRNGSTNRQVAVRIDGHDPSMLFFGGQEWAALSLPTADLIQAELLRGPVSAVYGGNAAGGVLSLVTREPRDSQGGRVKLSAGDPSTVGGELLWSQRLSERWFIKLQGSYSESEDLSVSRNTSVEYKLPCSSARTADCLPLEASPLNPNDDEITSRAFQADYHPERGGRLSVRGSASSISGPVILSDLGRLQIMDSDWRFATVDYELGPHWTLFGSFRDRAAGDQRVLATGSSVELSEESSKLGVRTSWDLSDRLTLVAGAHHDDQDVNTSQLPDRTRESPRSRLSPFSREASLLRQGVKAEADAFYSTLDWRPASKLSLGLGLRYDDSDLHDPQWSPRASLVYSPDESQSLRVTYSRGFQIPTYSELFMQFDSAPAVNLATIEPMCALFGVACGFDLDATLSAEDAPFDTTPDTRVLTLGNEALDVEQTQTVELGYRATRGGLLFTLDYHLSETKDLIVGPLPQLGTSLGRANPFFGPYQVPVQIPDAARAEILTELRLLLGDRFDNLSVNADGTPILTGLSYANLSSVDSQGADLGVDLRFAGGWLLAFSYSWLEFDTPNVAADLVPYLLPNAPEHRASASVGYVGTRFDAMARYRWRDDFRFVSGPFQGFVDANGTVDLFSNFHINPHLALGLNISNLLEEDQWQVFGGALQARRALASLTVSW